MSYLALKHLHVSAVALSGALFLLRGWWMLAAPARLQQRWVKLVPHLVDTVLLASAIALAAWSGQYPFERAWLTAKVLALTIYILLGTIALKRGRSRPIRLAALVGALLMFCYIVGVALTRDPAWNPG
ncbi:MAG: SirB2 family protein [Lacisediminimonas sp.]|nr:SirB2 family protein [Lacisediminimonas sp.]MDO8300531.1 SirB2 family protein [Lacisediminimonas sp.]